MNHTKHKWVSKRSGGYRGAGLQAAFPQPLPPQPTGDHDPEAFAAALEQVPSTSGVGLPSVATTDIDRSSVGGARRGRSAWPPHRPRPRPLAPGRDVHGGRDWDKGQCSLAPDPRTSVKHYRGEVLHGLPPTHPPPGPLRCPFCPFSNFKNRFI